MFLVAATALLRVMFQCKWNMPACQVEYATARREEAYAKASDSGVAKPASCISSLLDCIRAKSVSTARKYLPSPHSELLLGMVLGIDNLKKVPIFNEMLRDTGTIHVVVVSGYNINLVFELAVKMFGSRYKRRNVICAQILVFFYAMLSGFGAPVIRSLIMAVILSWGKYYGRSIDVLRVLLFSGLSMVVAVPVYVFDLSFQLSFLATLSLVLYSPLMTFLVHKCIKWDVFFRDDLASTLAAQVLVWPLISMNFGRVSLISPVVNALILWTVPLGTMIGGLMIMAGFVHPLFAGVISFIEYVPLDIFVQGIRFFSKFPFVVFDFQLDITTSTCYFAGVSVLAFFASKYSEKLKKS